MYAVGSGDDGRDGADGVSDIVDSGIYSEEAAPEVAEMLKAACSGTIYGQEAVDAFGDGSNGAQFDCLFINGVDRLTFDGTSIRRLVTLHNPAPFDEFAYILPQHQGKSNILRIILRTFLRAQ